MDYQDKYPMLLGQRVTIRAFTQADITEAYLSWLNDPIVLRFSNQRFKTHDRSSCRDYLKSFEGTDNLFLIVSLRDSGKAVGTMTAYISCHHGTADVGIMIGDRAVWGQGYGQDAWNTVVNWLLRKTGIRKVTAGTIASNHAMVKLMERSHMSLEAVRKSQELVDGMPQDIVLYARFQSA